MFIARAAAIYSLGYGLRTFTAVLKSTHPSTVRGTVKWISAYGLSNNNNGDGGCGWMMMNVRCKYTVMYSIAYILRSCDDDDDDDERSPPKKRLVIW